MKPLADFDSSDRTDTGGDFEFVTALHASITLVWVWEINTPFPSQLHKYMYMHIHTDSVHTCSVHTTPCSFVPTHVQRGVVHNMINASDDNSFHVMVLHAKSAFLRQSYQACVITAKSLKLSFLNLCCEVLHAAEKKWWDQRPYQYR